jgi:hypothetical protein
MQLYNVSGFKSHERHGFDTQSRESKFARFAIFDRLVVVIQHFNDDEFGMVVSAVEMFTFGKGSTHFGGGVSRIQLDAPFFCNFLASTLGVKSGLRNGSPMQMAPLIPELL